MVTEAFPRGRSCENERKGAKRMPENARKEREVTLDRRRSEPARRPVFCMQRLRAGPHRVPELLRPLEAVVPASGITAG